MIDRASAVPPWRQVADLLKQRIETGELQPGTMLSIVTVAQEHGIARNTARKVLYSLRDDGLVDITPGWGTFVKARGN